jgi:hypothetical protein
MFFSHEALAHSIVTLAAALSGIGVIIAGVMVYFAARVLHRIGGEVDTGSGNR